MAMWQKLRRGAGAAFNDGFFTALAKVGTLHPRADPAQHGVEVVRDVPYQAGGLREHRLDVWRPKDRKGPLPALIYVHGGAFRILSKDSHWVFGLAFARRGFVVFNLSYRLSPQHPFPAAVEDVCAAYQHIVAHAHEYGAQLDDLVLAGESAGANLVVALALAACFERSEPFARGVFATGVVPKVVLPACGVFQVSDQARFRRRRPHKISTFIEDRLQEVEDAYLKPAKLDNPQTVHFADPLAVFEGDQLPVRPLPAFFLGVGTSDPLLDDTRRLHAALQHRGVDCEVRYYPKQLHAFHALVMFPQARQYWRDQFAFLARVLGRPFDEPPEQPR